MGCEQERSAELIRPAFPSLPPCIRVSVSVPAVLRRKIVSSSDSDNGVIIAISELLPVLSVDAFSYGCVKRAPRKGGRYFRGARFENLAISQRELTATVNAKWLLMMLVAASFAPYGRAVTVNG